MIIGQILSSAKYTESSHFPPGIIEETVPLAVSNFHPETMRLAQEAIDRYRHPERNIAGMTLGISEKSYEKIQALLIETRKKIVEIANNDETADRVYQVNFQTFPLSRKKNSPKASS